MREVKGGEEQTTACHSIGVYEHPTLQTTTVALTPKMTMDQSWQQKQGKIGRPSACFTNVLACGM
jgi:hypothetical protein